MAKCIGIDLGTTNSVAGHKAAEVRIIQNRESEDLTRSCVAWYKGRKGEGQILVGTPAINIMKSAYKDTIISVKRLMGRAYSDMEVQEARKKLPYEVVSPSEGTDEDLRVVMGGKQYSPIQISSMILKKIKEDAEERLNDKVEQAVITVPAYFTDKQRDATRKAGWLAGLKVQRILPEPTAAAIAYGIDNIGENEAKTILIYDLGGGTFDVSILSIAGGIFAELGIAGDMWLGGDDFDQKIIDYVIEKVREENDIDIEKIEEKEKISFKVELKIVSEKAKKALSSSIRTEITLIGMLKDEENNLIDVVVDLTREQFEQMIQNDIKRSIELVHTAIKNAHLTAEQIDNIILVGGSTMIPMVKRALTDAFGKEKVLTNVDPMKSVAQGAAILAARLGGEIECPGCKTINPNDRKECLKCGKPLTIGDIIYGVTGMDYGIMTIGNKFEPVIKKGSPYPSPEPVIEPFYTSVNNMRRIKVPVYAHDENKNSLEHQAIVWLELPENIPQDIPVDVALALDSSGILEKVKVSLKDGSGREIEVCLDRGGEKRSKIEKRLDELKRKWDEKRKDADVSTAEKIENLYSEVIRAANANEVDKAEKRLEEFGQEVEKIGKDISNLPQWKRKADGLTGYTDFIVEEYGYLLDPQKTYKLKKLVEELKSASAKDNQKLAEEKTEEIDKELDTIPGIVKNLMTIIDAIITAQNKGDVIRSDKLKSMRSEIESALKRNDSNTVNRVFNEVIPIVKEIFESAGEDMKGVTTIEELLKKKKGQSTSDKY